MKKALVVGGSSGIGLAIVKKLVDCGYYTIVLSRHKPEQIFNNDELQYVKHIYFDLNDFDVNIINDLSKDNDISCIFFTAGIGRVSSFENIDDFEIKRLFDVNASATIRIIKYFYNRIKSNENFNCCIIGSIAGMISSPLFSVYAATKAALFRFAESINIELEMSNIGNRILLVAPSYVNGTKFHGGENNIDLIIDLANEIIERTFNNEQLFIPEYSNKLCDILNKYNNNPHQFGIESYNYKLNNNRIKNKSNLTIGYMSGTFDLFHIGHLNILKRAKNECDYLIVGVHPSAAHKGKETFIPFDERKKIVESCKYVDKVVDSCPEDSDAWDLYHYDKLFVGSDYKNSERFNRYEKIFANRNVKIIYFQYTDSTSSTKIRQLIENKIVLS